MSLQRLTFPLLILFTLCVISLAGSQPCLPRQFGKKKSSIVCVCNETYCDNVPQLGTLKPYQAVIYKSSKDGKRFERSQAAFISNGKLKKAFAERKIKINAQERYQSIIGFGGAFTDSAGINILSLSQQMRSVLLQSYFADDGLQYSIGRIPIASCDFSTHEYSYNDVDGDFELRNFNLTYEDLKLKIPFVQEALKLTNGDMKLLGSPWSAPGWMKTNGRMKGGGRLKGDQDGPYYATWAKYYVRFLEEYAKNNVPLWGLTVQNEPSTGALPTYSWQTMYFNSEMEKNFIKNHLGPTLKNSSLGKDIALMILDDNRFLIPTWPKTVLRDDEASKYISGIAVHWYEDMALFPPSRLAEVHESHPDKFILGTEACNGYLEWDRGPKLGSWSRGESYAKDIIEDLLNWVSGWTDWNLCLDLQGGPNWVKNFVDASVIVNTTANEFYKQPMFYVMGHFSKFLRPGSIRIGISLPTDSGSKELMGVAFATPLQQRVLVLLNLGNSAVENLVIVDATMIKRSMQISLEPRSIATIIWNKAR